jgi:N-acetylglucosaminyl-diphospho-decaprenol L-rhamnosyltransferase
MACPAAGLDIVIVNWNAGSGLRDCLQSIAHANRNTYKLNRVVVVDNASSDGSVDNLKGLDLPVTLIKNSRNLGFAAACNQGALGSEADYVLFLNPDTKVFSETLESSVAWMSTRENARTGILGVQLVDETGNVSRTCARFPNPSMFLAKMFGFNRLLPRHFPDHFYIEWDHKDSRTVEQVMGAFFLVRESVFMELGGFDERFFVYFEEVDFSLRAKQAGWDTYFLASTQCYHRGGGTSEQVKARRLYYSLQSRILYSLKHFGTRKSSFLLLGTLFIEPVARVAQCVVRLSPRSVWEVMHGYCLLWAATPAILFKRGLRAFLW